MPAKSGNDAIAIPFVFNFQHHSLIGLIIAFTGFGHDTIEASTFEALKPFRCDL
jgi:hypothetical protein